MHKRELLAPAGELKAVKPMLDAGANAVYVGLEGYSSRPISADLNINEVLQASEIAHTNGGELYVAINGCIQDNAVDQLNESIAVMDDNGIDAVIISDWGILFELLKRNLKMEIHASTLLGVYNSETVKALRNQGVNRVVLSSNLFIDEISKIISEVPQLDYELIAEGGICFNDNRICELPHSGEGNAYRVFCRENYNLVVGNSVKEARPIAAKHISLCEVLSMYYELGISSFKVEGRTVEYKYIVPRIKRLREAMDLCSFDTDNYSSLHYVTERRAQ